jgi:hypothetical protein
MSFRVHINKTSFSSEFKNESNKLECYITLGWKGLTVTNTLAFKVHSSVTKNMKCFE